MNIWTVIENLYPDLEFYRDYEVFDSWDWKWQVLLWHNKEIEEPSQELLKNTWNEISIKIEIWQKLTRMKEIRSKLIEL